MTGTRKTRHLKLLGGHGDRDRLRWYWAMAFTGICPPTTKETYKGLKLFSDVIEIVQKNYVDEVDNQKNHRSGHPGNGPQPGSSLFPAASRCVERASNRHSRRIHRNRHPCDHAQQPGDGDFPHRRNARLPGGNQGRGQNCKGGRRDHTEDLRDAVKRMRGPKGTTVEITILRQGAPEPSGVFSLVRDVIPIYSVKAELLKPGYGYVWITNFRENTTSDLVEALEAMEQADAPLKGLVLDLRDNPGGILNQAINVSDLFLESGEILSIKGREGQNTKVFSAHPSETKRDYPIVLLVNGGSASASEIVAGALQDHKRALILGTTSFGKGSVQTVESLRDGYGLKFTIARYYTPSGRSIQAKGVEPDVVVQHRTLSDNNVDNARTIKESDLKNHLNAEPTDDFEEPIIDTDDQEEEAPAAPEDPPLLKEFKSKHSPLDREALLNDNQVLRALDILISYDIFKTLKNG